jgi:oligoribonuclease (3'-5' exoribonuclease)
MLITPSKYVGLDLECTGSNHRKHVICQIGLAVRTPGGTPTMFRSDVGSNPGSYMWEDAALNVNKFTHERIQGGPRWPQVNELALSFLTLFAPAPKRLYTVGWNVGGFDLQFVNNESPEVMTRLHYRHVDLNSVNSTVAVVLNRDSNKIKKEAKTYAGEMTLAAFPEFGSADKAWHDAGFDAVASLYAWQWYINYLQSDEFEYTKLGQRILASGVSGAETKEAQAETPEAES